MVCNFSWAENGPMSPLYASYRYSNSPRIKRLVYSLMMMSCALISFRQGCQVLETVSPACCEAWGSLKAVSKVCRVAQLDGVYNTCTVVFQRYTGITFGVFAQECIGIRPAVFTIKHQIMQHKRSILMQIKRWNG